MGGVEAELVHNREASRSKTTRSPLSQPVLLAARHCGGSEASSVSVAPTPYIHVCGAQGVKLLVVFLCLLTSSTFDGAVRKEGGVTWRVADM